MPLIPLEILVLMKLRAGRPQDLADVAHLVAAGRDIDRILSYLDAHEPQHVPAFSAIAETARFGG